MFKNITSYLGECRCGVCAQVCVLNCACGDGVCVCVCAFPCMFVRMCVCVRCVYAVCMCVLAVYV